MMKTKIKNNHFKTFLKLIIILLMNYKNKVRLVNQVMILKKNMELCNFFQKNMNRNILRG